MRSRGLFTIRPRARTTVKARPEGKRRKDCGSCSQNNFFERGSARLVVSRRADTIVCIARRMARTSFERGSTKFVDERFFFRQFATSLKLSLFFSLSYLYFSEILDGE